jgi:hypothetical protein
MADFEYCNQKCSVGKAASQKCLDKNESVSDAAIDFWYFIEECFKTCPYKDKHKTEER